MSTPIPYFIALAAILFFLVHATVWSRRGTWARPAAIVILFITLPLFAAAYVESMGFHRPINLAWGLKKAEIQIIGIKLVQDKAIYLYADDPSREEPRPLSLPWSNEVADKLAKLADQSQQEGGDGTFMFRFDPSLDVNANQFHPMPQQKAMPPKEVPPEPRFYQDS